MSRKQTGATPELKAMLGLIDDQEYLRQSNAMAQMEEAIRAEEADEFKVEASRFVTTSSAAAAPKVPEESIADWWVRRVTGRGR